MLRIGIDTGGTFTDLSVFDEDDGRVCLTHKVPSQPRDPTAAIAAGLGEITAKLPDAVRYVLHGTTIGLNTLLEGREPAPGLLVTEGFRDILELTANGAATRCTTCSSTAPGCSCPGI